MAGLWCRNEWSWQKTIGLFQKYSYMVACNTFDDLEKTSARKYFRSTLKYSAFAYFPAVKAAAGIAPGDGKKNIKDFNSAVGIFNFVAKCIYITFINHLIG